MILTDEMLRHVMPHAPDFAPWTPVLNEVMAKYEINTPLRGAHFIAQCAHESNQFISLVEDLHYSADRLMMVWPSIFKTIDLAMKYSTDEVKLGNFIYANRMGNGDEESGDGYRFRGRGIFQITGKTNYYALADAMGVDRQVIAEWTESIQGACASAGWYWSVKGLNTWADRDAIEMITTLINGGQNGIDERRAYFEKAKEVFQ